MRESIAQNRQKRPNRGQKHPNSGQSRPNRGQNRKKSKRKTLIYCAIGFVILLIAIIASLILFSRSTTDAVIRIPRDATEKQLSDTLHKYYPTGYADKVLIFTKLLSIDPASRYGSYDINSGTSAFNAARRLARGKRQELKVTINGFRSANLIADRVATKLDFTSDELKAVLADSNLLAQYGLTPDQALALFIDDTYIYTWNTSADAFVRKIGDNYLKVWDDTRKSKAQALGLTPAEVMTICSIVDEETNKSDEKGTIGRLYINRLQHGMKLQADPTVRYAVGDFTIRRVTGAHLRVQSPYNTYLNAGLPPGPIRTTSVATIDAVLNSEPHNYLYMCAKSDFSGYHDFAADYATHMQNARRYQQALDKRGITKTAK